jgi:hypothetical protein
MATMYRKADPDTAEMLGRVMKECHKLLVEATVRVGVLLASTEIDQEGRPKSAPVKSHGVPCVAKTRLINRKQRLQGVPFEAVIEIDEHRWELMTEEAQEAVIDHELTHLELKRDPDTNLPLSDDDGRPKLKLLPDDWVLTGFADVVRRRGRWAIEAQAIKDLHDHYGAQLLFPWMEMEKAEVYA